VCALACVCAWEWKNARVCMCMVQTCVSPDVLNFFLAPRLKWMRGSERSEHINTHVTNRCFEKNYYMKDTTLKHTLSLRPSLLPRGFTDSRYPFSSSACIPQSRRKRAERSRAAGETVNPRAVTMNHNRLEKKDIPDETGSLKSTTASMNGCL